MLCAHSCLLHKFLHRIPLTPIVFRRGGEDTVQIGLREEIHALDAPWPYSGFPYSCEELAPRHFVIFQSFVQLDWDREVPGVRHCFHSAVRNQFCHGESHRTARNPYRMQFPGGYPSVNRRTAHLQHKRRILDGDIPGSALRSRISHNLFLHCGFPGKSAHSPPRLVHLLPPAPPAAEHLPSELPFKDPPAASADRSPQSPHKKTVKSHAKFSNPPERTFRDLRTALKATDVANLCKST